MSHVDMGNTLTQPAATNPATQELTFLHSTPDSIAVEVINRHSTPLITAFSNDLHYFSTKFIELGFVSKTAADDIPTKLGIGNREKGRQLLNLVIDNCSISLDMNKWFNKFVAVFSSEAAYADLATRMIEEFSTGKHSGCGPSPTRHETSLQAVARGISPSNTTSTGTSHIAHGLSSSQHTLPTPPPAAQLHQKPLHYPSAAQPLSHSSFSSEPPLQEPIMGYHWNPQPPSSQSQNTNTNDRKVKLQIFIDYVKTIYRESEVERDTKVVKWPPTPSTVYINLACINRKSVSVKSREYNDITEAMVHDGNVDVINTTKGLIEFIEIAISILSGKLSDSRAPQTSLILVEGAPGVDKSLFAWEFCRRWERGGSGGITQQYQLVLLLRLRNDKISKAKSLKELMCHSNEHVSQCVIDE